MKRCPVCKEWKEDEEFAWKFRGLGIRAGTCKLCQKIYRDDYYHRNRQKIIDITADRRRRYKAEVKAWIIAYLQEHPCVDCGETDIMVLEFDHEDPSQKTANVGQLIGGGHSLRRVKVEVSKCVVRCANCHRRKTARDQGWYKGR
jgi:hypothetical protein